jgi:hypothetical protein
MGENIIDETREERWPVLLNQYRDSSLDGHRGTD